MWGERLAAAFTMPALSGSLHSAPVFPAGYRLPWRSGRDDRREDVGDELLFSRAPVEMTGLKRPLFHRVVVMAVIG